MIFKTLIAYYQIRKCFIRRNLDKNIEAGFSAQRMLANATRYNKQTFLSRISIGPLILSPLWNNSFNKNHTTLV